MKIIFYFQSDTNGEMIQFDECFSDGWFNHQLDLYFSKCSNSKSQWVELMICKGRFLAEIAAAEGSPASLLTSYVLPAEPFGGEGGGSGSLPKEVHHSGAVDFDGEVRKTYPPFFERSCESFVRDKISSYKL